MNIESVRSELRDTVINHWEDYVDYVCFKTSCENINPCFYYLEEHPVYRSNISSEGKNAIKIMQNIGCYGTSEIIKNLLDDEEECVEIQINITELEQVINVLEYMNTLLPISEEVRELVLYLSKINLPQMGMSDYLALYFGGYVKNKGEINRIKFYFKTFDVCESENTSDYYLEKLEKIQGLTDNKAFAIIKSFITSGKGILRCVGLDYRKDQSYRLKYYIQGKREFDDGKYLYDNWQMVSEKDICLLENIDKIKKNMRQFKNLSCKFIQISNINQEEVKVNLYYKFEKKSNKKYYSLRDDLVLRNIGGIYFVVDIRDKECYDLKLLLSLNEMGKEIFNYMKKYGVFSIQGIVSYIENIIIDYTPEMHSKIEMDVKNYVFHMQKKGYVLEMNGGE